jgi:hypothetical protein
MVAIAEQTYLEELLANGEELIANSEDLLKIKGVEYSLSEWLTPMKYCEKFNIENVAVITNWINRGKIPSENIRVIEELNNLKLIKAVPYK